mmetsp:Transcript_31124/g.52032  ORF Transcript_31124/g.52032 Transcript_31124/m.52032 type:complete len:268 (+) Transcript_31124:10-813(+)
MQISEEEEAVADREAEKIAELQYIYERQLKSYLQNSQLFAVTFAGCDSEYCKQVSRSARQSLGFTSPSLSYGEVNFESFGALVLSLTKYDVNLTQMYNFVDLGSGTGKAVIAATLLGIFEKCAGLEIIKDLHDIATTTVKRYYLNNTGSHIVTIDYMHGDATYTDWSQTDMVFCHATCFDRDMMKRIANTASKMRKGSIFISVSTRLPCDDMFILIATGELEVSWGMATAFMYRRNDAPAPGNVTDPKLHLDTVLAKDIPELKLSLL